MMLKQFDIGTTYLNSNLVALIHMQPLGFRNLIYPDYVCPLLRSLYQTVGAKRHIALLFDCGMKGAHFALDFSDPRPGIYVASLGPSLAMVPSSWLLMSLIRG